MRRVATSLTVVIGFLDKLQLLDKLAVTDMTYVNSPCLKKRQQQCGSTRHLSPSGADWLPNPEWMELTSTSNCTHGVDLVLTDLWDSGASGTVGRPPCHPLDALRGEPPRSGDGFQNGRKRFSIAP